MASTHGARSAPLASVLVFLALTLVVLSVESCGGGGVEVTDPDVTDDGGGDDGTSETDDAVQLRDEAADALFGGSDDFAGAIAKLDRAVSIDPEDEAAQLLLAIARFLRFCQETAVETGGAVRNLYERAGYFNTGGGGSTGTMAFGAGDPSSFWDFDLQEALHGEGDIKDSTPDADEMMAFLCATFIPELTTLAYALRGTSTGFEYLVDTQRIGGRFFEELDAADRLVYRWDYGDVMAMHAAAATNLAWFSMLCAYDWDGLRPNDFDELDDPNLDPEDVVYQEYPSLGRIANPSRIEDARIFVEQAWESYLNASWHVRNETAAQAATGILTLGRDMFNSTAEREEFLDDEEDARSWGQDLVSRLRVDESFTITTLPDGTPLDTEDRVHVNVSRLFAGRDLHTLYFKTIVNPFTGDRSFGVTNWSQLTTDMATLGGVFLGVGSKAPTVGDIPPQGYAILVSTPPWFGKVIDGSFSDWATAGVSTQVGAAPSATAHPEFPDGLLPEDCPKNVPNVGNVHVSRLGENLYVYIDQDLTSYVLAPWDRFTVEVRGPEGVGALNYDAYWGFQTYGSSSSLTPSYGSGSGIEIEFPTGWSGTGSWAEVSIRVDGRGPGGAFRSERSDIFVKVR